MRSFLRPVTGCLLTLALPAHADVVTYLHDDADFYAVVRGMPDLDQSRTSDAWDAEGRGDGAMYCGPTSAANVLNYLANEGWSVGTMSIDLEPSDTAGLRGVDLFSANIANAMKFQFGSDLIADLADEMGTDPTSGTGSTQIRDALRDRLPSGFEVTREGGKDCSGDFDEIIHLRRIFDHLDAGHLVLARIGYYEPGTRAGRQTRVGGHWIVPTGLLRTPDVRRLWWADPARDEDGGTGASSTQSPFISDVSDLASETVVTAACSRTRWRLLDRAPASTADAARRTYLEELVVIALPGT